MNIFFIFLWVDDKGICRKNRGIDMDWIGAHMKRGDVLWALWGVNDTSRFTPHPGPRAGLRAGLQVRDRRFTLRSRVPHNLTRIPIEAYRVPAPGRVVTFPALSLVLGAHWSATTSVSCSLVKRVQRASKDNPQLGNIWQMAQNEQFETVLEVVTMMNYVSQ